MLAFTYGMCHIYEPHMRYTVLVVCTLYLSGAGAHVCVCVCVNQFTFQTKMPHLLAHIYLTLEPDFRPIPKAVQQCNVVSVGSPDSNGNIMV